MTQGNDSSTPLLSPVQSNPAILAAGCRGPLPGSADSPAALLSATPRAFIGKLLMEVLGTAVLVGTIQLALSSGSPQAALAIAGMLVALIHIGAPVSGAHYNPAVTLAFVLRGRVAVVGCALPFVAAELAGGWIGAAGAAAIGGGKAVAFHPPDGPGAAFARAAAAEVVFTALLCFAILATVTLVGVPAVDPPVFAFAISAVVYAAAVAIGPVSGAGLNPAVVLGLAAVNPAENGGICYTVMMCVAELVGGAVGTLALFAVIPEQFTYYNEGAKSLLNVAALAGSSPHGQISV